MYLGFFEPPSMRSSFITKCHTKNSVDVHVVLQCNVQSNCSSVDACGFVSSCRFVALPRCSSRCICEPLSIRGEWLQCRLNESPVTIHTLCPQFSTMNRCCRRSNVNQASLLISDLVFVLNLTLWNQSWDTVYWA